MSDRTLLLTPEQTAERLGIAPRTMANWRVVGAGPPFVRVGSRVRYTIADLETWVQTRTVGHTSQSA